MIWLQLDADHVAVGQVGWYLNGQQEKISGWCGALLVYLLSDFLLKYLVVWVQEEFENRGKA